ncbi:flagellar biosynthetic protein FliO [bacterium]|nr:flagellar biosynthetic protein FliO [bacterium]
MNKFWVLLFCMFLNVAQAFASITIPAGMKQTLKATADTPSLFNLVASLLIVIIMIYIVGWIYMKLSHINSKQLFRQQDLPLNKPKLISGITLGQNRNLHVVELNNKYLVLGVTPNSINLIKEFDKKEIADANLIIEKAIKEKNIEELDEKEIVNELFNDNELKTQNTEIEDICKKYL